MARRCENVLATTHAVYIYVCMYVYVTSNGNSLVRLCPARKRRKIKGGGSTAACAVLALPNQSECPSTLWDFEQQLGSIEARERTYTHMHTYAYIQTPAMWDTRSRLIPMLGQSVNGCRFVCTLRLWHGLASPVLFCPGLGWPGLAWTTSGFEHSNETHNVA